MAALSMSDEVDLQLAIPLAALVDEITCPICFSWCRTAAMTPCGHNFCKDCLSECLNRSKKCPVCSQGVAGGMAVCVDNKHHDRLVAILRVERDKASKRYFEDLIGGGGASGAGGGGSGGAGGGGGGGEQHNEGGAAPAANKLSPIEEVFHAHLKKGLLEYEHFYESIREKFKRSIADAKQASAVRTQVASEKLKDPERKAELDALVSREVAKCEAIVAELEESLEASTSLLVESYSTYLKDAIPDAPHFLPVAVSVEVPSKNLSLKRIVLKPTDSAADVLDLIVAKLEAVGNPVVKMGDDLRWTIRAPFAGLGSDVGSSAAAASADDAAAAADSDKSAARRSKKHRKKDDIITVKNLRAPLLQLGIVPGAQIILEGTVQCKDDLPKQCFRQVFEKGQEFVVDYFSCRDCRINWLCKSCAESCHADHRVVEYMPQHKPSWACCYCFKSKCCVLSTGRGANKE